MQLLCPNCHRPIPSEDIALAPGWAKCRRCDEVFQLAEILPGYSAAGGAGPPGGLPERPFDAWVVVDRAADHLIIAIPPQGMRAATWGMLGFATFWLAFIAFWTAGALGVFAGGKIRWEHGLFAAFSTPFWLIGFGMLGGVLWSARGSRRVYLDASTLYTESRCLSARWRKTIDRSEVQHAREGVVQVKNQSNNASYTPYSVEIVYTKGSYRLPCNTEAEQQWLIGQINDFLQTLPYRPAPSGSASWAAEMEN